MTWFAWSTSGLRANASCLPPPLPSSLKKKCHLPSGMRYTRRSASSSGASFFAWQRRARNEWLVMNRKGPWEGYRQQALSPSRLPLRAHFHQKRDVWVRGSKRVVSSSSQPFWGSSRNGRSPLLLGEKCCVMPLPKEGGGGALRDDPKNGRKSKETRGDIQKQNSHKQNDTLLFQ